MEEKGSEDLARVYLFILELAKQIEKGLNNESTTEQH